MQQKKTKSGKIHPTAVIDPSAKLGSNVRVGPYCVIGADVVVGDDCELASHVTLRGPTVIGKGNRFFDHAAIGGDPQDKKFQGEPESRLEIGDNNYFREFVTINRGSVHGGGLTRLGSDNWLMAYCHMAHDCDVGNNTIFANNTILAGHVTVEDRVYMGGFTGVHQFCRLGTLAMTGGHTMIAQDVPPYVIAAGNRAKLYGVNKIGLQRAGIAAEETRSVQKAYKLYFRSRLAAKDAMARIEEELKDSPMAQHFLAFIRASQRGILR
jgi:UDP-N-acetylglucosamine acyltransferase